MHPTVERGRGDQLRRPQTLPHLYGQCSDGEQRRATSDARRSPSRRGDGAITGRPRAAVIKKQAPKRCRGSRTAIAARERGEDQEGGCSGCCPATLSSRNPRRGRVQHVTSSMRKQDHNNEAKKASLFCAVHTRGDDVRSLPVGDDE